MIYKLRVRVQFNWTYLYPESVPIQLPVSKFKIVTRDPHLVKHQSNSFEVILDSSQSKIFYSCQIFARTS